MATQSPISTISYNTEAFLREKLDSLVNSHTIQCFMYICHKGEDGDKDHIHLRIEPNKRIDPMAISELLKEYVLNESKPRGIRPWRPSKEEDWFLYVVHDPSYLKLKYGGGEKGEKLPYSVSDIFTSSDYDLETAFIRAKASMAHTSANLATRLQSGEDPLALALQGENPYTVNALLRMLNTTDYQRILGKLADLREQYESLSDRFGSLLGVLSANGIQIEFDDDGFAVGIASSSERLASSAPTEAEHSFFDLEAF